MSQQIFQTLQRDPRTSPLANNGQARITTLDDENARRELAGELSTFVCDGQYGQAMERILQSYLAQQGQARQNAAWVAGFFGSGKSHLQKMLGHLWANTEVSPGKRARPARRASKAPSPSMPNTRPRRTCICGSPT